MTAICHINDIPDGNTKGFELNELSLFVVNQYGNFYVYRNRCPHLGVELNWLEDQFLDTDNALIQCASHGALFLIDSGECVSGPCNGQQLEPVPFKLENDQLLLTDIAR